MTAAPRSFQPDGKANYRNLVFDIGWYGIALAATTRFLQFFALDMGASAMDLGWLTALPALIVLFTTSLSPWWRQRHNDSVHAVLLPGFIQRMAFLLPVFAPFFPQQWRVPWIIFASTLPMIGQGTVSAIFMIMMRETIEDSDLTRLVNSRQMAMNIAMTIGAIAFGLMLERIVFPLNYQIMFVVAFAFSIISQLHLTRLHVLRPEQSVRRQPKRSYRVLFSDPAFRSVALVVLAAFASFHLVIAVTPIQLKNGLHFSQGYMGLYGALEVAAGFAITLVMNRLMQRFGARRLIAMSLVATAAAPLVIAFAPSQTFALLAAVLSGAAWSAIGISCFAYFAERTAKNDMQAAMVYQQIVYIAIFVMPLLGSGLVNMGVSVVTVLVVGALVRLLGAGICEMGLMPHKRRFSALVEPVGSGD